MAKKESEKSNKKWIIVLIVIILLLLFWCFFFGPCGKRSGFKAAVPTAGCTQGKALQATKEYIQKFNYFDWPTIVSIKVFKDKNYKFVFTLSKPPRGDGSALLTDPFSQVNVDQTNCQVLNSTHGLTPNNNINFIEIPKSYWP